MTLFPIEDLDPPRDDFNVGEMTDAERRFVDALRGASAESDFVGHGNFLVRTGDPLIAAAYMPHGSGCVAVHFHGDSMRCDWAHNQLFDFPVPSDDNFEASGEPAELGRRAARWFHERINPHR